MNFGCFDNSDSSSNTQDPPKIISSPGKKIFSVLMTILLVGYPIIVYVVIKYLGVRAAALLLITLLVPRAIHLKIYNRKDFLLILIQVVCVLLLASLTLVFKNPLFLQQVPALISLFFFCSFSFTLFKPPPMVERFARLVQDDLTRDERSHCRVVTYIWVGFFLIHAVIIEMLTLVASFDAWTVYTGVLGYILMGIIFSGEYIVRKKRFGRFKNNLLDRCLQHILLNHQMNPNIKNEGK